MALIPCAVQLLLLFILLNLTNESFSKEKLVKKSLRSHVPAKINQRTFNTERRLFLKKKASPFRKIKPESSSNFKKTQNTGILKGKLIKKKLLQDKKRKHSLKKKTRIIKHVSLRRKMDKIKNKKIHKTGRRYKKHEKSRLGMKPRSLKRKNLKTLASPKKSVTNVPNENLKAVASPKKPATNVHNDSTEKSLSSNERLKEGLNRLAKIEKLLNVTLSPNFNRTAFVRRAVQRGVPEKTDFERFIANNQGMLDHKYWKRRFEFYYYDFNEAIREAKKNMRKHGKNPDKIKNKDLCHYLFDRKCYQKGEKVCTEKDSSGDCKKWYELPFRYDESGKVQSWMVKFWDKKPETPRELERERDDQIEARRYNTCTLQHYSPEGYPITYCVPVYNILRRYPELAKRIENLYPDYSKSQNYFISDAESIVNGIINAAEEPDCQLIERLFPFLKQYFDNFAQDC